MPSLTLVQVQERLTTIRATLMTLLATPVQQYSIKDRQAIYADIKTFRDQEKEMELIEMRLEGSAGSVVYPIPRGLP